jgi:hypothetical protein
VSFLKPSFITCFPEARPHVLPPGPTTGTLLHPIVHVPQPKPAHFSCGVHRKDNRRAAAQITPGNLLGLISTTTPFVTLKLQVFSPPALSAAPAAANHSEKPLTTVEVSDVLRQAITKQCAYPKYERMRRIALSFLLLLLEEMVQVRSIPECPRGLLYFRIETMATTSINLSGARISSILSHNLRDDRIIG